MRVILDTSSISSKTQSSYRYFSELIPRFRAEKALSIELVPSQYFETPEEWGGALRVHGTLLPKATWFPEGRLKKGLSKLKWAIERNHLGRKLGKAQERSVFHSFLYSLPPTNEILFVPNALDLIVERHGSELGMGSSITSLMKRKQACFDRADRIMAISQNTKDDLVSTYSLNPEKIDVIHLAVNEQVFGTTPTVEATRLTYAKFGITGPFLLQVGGRMHHRNFSRLLHAFATGTLSKNCVLVAAGEPWGEEEVQEIKSLGLQKSVIVVPRPTDTELCHLYHGAEMLVYPSLYEGFGFPIIEAMVSGLPVVTSLGSGSVPEIAGDAALYFDPRDPSDIAKKIQELLDPKVKEALIKKGFENVKRFSWDETARKTLLSYQRAVLQS